MNKECYGELFRGITPRYKITLSIWKKGDNVIFCTIINGESLNFVDITNVNIFRLVEEIDTVLGSKTYIDSNDLLRMHYLDMVWKETLRLYPPSISTVRETEEDHLVGGYLIPRNTSIHVRCHQYMLTRNNHIYTEPLQLIC